MSDNEQSIVATKWPEQLAVRIARCYYELGMTQQEIANRLGIGRARVIRLLAEARERGIIDIRINSTLLELVELGDRLVDQYQLDWSETTLCYSEDESEIAQAVAQAACEWVPRYINDGMTIGIGWGETLQRFARELPNLPKRDISVIALLGSLTRRSSMTRYEATTALSAKLDAECLYLPGPIVCDDRAGRDVLAKQPLFKEVYSRALESDIAVVSIGGLKSTTIRRVNFVTEDEFNSVIAVGAIGNFLGYYIDASGQLVDHDINERVLGLRLEEFRKIPQRIMISGGADKIPALKAVLQRGLITALITDEATARALSS